MEPNNISPDILLYGILGGLIPAYIWLRFWLREEAHQEPRGKILGSFLSGMVAVLVAIPLEIEVSRHFPVFTLTSLFLWALIEEVLKFMGAYFVVLKTRFVDEPVDPIIYLISSALGFAAMENILFLMGPLFDGDITKTVITINLRFLGATVLHIISSGVVGIAIGYAFFKNRISKNIILSIGLLVATVLHTYFNYFIMDSESNLFGVFSLVWIGMFIVLTILHKIKNIKNIQ